MTVPRRYLQCGTFYNPPHDGNPALWYHVCCPCVRLSLRPSVRLSYVRPYLRSRTII